MKLLMHRMQEHVDPLIEYLHLRVNQHVVRLHLLDLKVLEDVLIFVEIVS